MAGHLRIIIQPSAEQRDVRIDRSRSDEGIVSPDLAQKLGAGRRAASAIDEGNEEIIRFGGK